MRRASIILAAADGETNSNISLQWQLDRNRVRYWRQHWLQGQSHLEALEQAQTNDEDFRRQILELLSDAQRPGVTPTFLPEQVVQIIAIACESPSASGRPINHWTPEEIADEAMKRNIVSSVSASSVRRFLGGSPTPAAS